MRSRKCWPASAALLALALLVGFPAAGQAEDAALEQKARDFRAALLDRHLSREGLVIYRVNLDTVREDLEHGTYPQLADVPMFTGLFAAASCSRASVEADPTEALADAERALDGLLLLMKVTGERGLLARSVRRDHGVRFDERRGRWMAGAAPYTRYVFRRDVSADQYAHGLLPAVSACARFFPERTRTLAVDAAEHLLAHDMHLTDPDGRRTRYGDMSWRSGFGFNAIFQITGWGIFAWAAELDPDPRLAAQRDRLRDRDRVLARSRRTNLRIGALTNPSNDLMAFNLYRSLVPLARRNGDPALADLRHAMHRDWQRVRGDGSAYFAAVLCYVEPESCDRGALADARTLLAGFPLDKTLHDTGPELARLPTRWLRGRKGARMAREPVPMRLRPVSSLEWKSSPYRVEPRVAPRIENSGVDYLMAWWLLLEAERGLPE